ncbi:MAG TPA: slipin family protein [Cyclobacteriaceae bacterium]|nr:slipin family protein [Cyclobacteriaceae bacterium]HMV10889.1 slipin family protein [Cyclobacteriaceae bacterium]HMV88882.1 slipin family protein [Cyclobacteriaceae bacterium]HMW99670.1 slipin family protein [Cyclobacteriaceae bacterium]HMX50953.1 slipin family protein [Cyclobacteriaceae bacterium]
MKRIRINAGKIGLVLKHNSLKRVVAEGAHWLSLNEHVREYDLTMQFSPLIDLNLLLKNPTLTNWLQVVDVKDHEIVLHYENGVFKQVLKAGRHAFWKGVIDHTFVRADLSKIDITENITPDTLVRKDVSSFVRVFTVESFEQGILLVDGKFARILETGVYMFWKNATPVAVQKTDLRQLQLEISGQEILTRDKANLRINFFVQYRVVDIVKALIETKDFERQLYILMQLALREFIGTLSLDELLEKKESVSAYVLSALHTQASAVGIELRDCGVRDIILPGDMKEILNQVLLAQKKAEANVIMRREETASTRSLLNTAKLMEDNVMLFKLKEMEYVEKIADKINSISLSGGNQIVDQLKDIFVPKK